MPLAQCVSNPKARCGQGLLDAIEEIEHDEELVPTFKCDIVANAMTRSPVESKEKTCKGLLY